MATLLNRVAVGVGLQVSCIKGRLVAAGSQKGTVWCRPQTIIATRFQFSCAQACLRYQLPPVRTALAFSCTPPGCGGSSCHVLWPPQRATRRRRIVRSRGTLASLKPYHTACLSYWPCSIRSSKCSAYCNTRIPALSSTRLAHLRAISSLSMRRRSAWSSILTNGLPQHTR
ncbi:hypothetical protein BDV96DRAFT_374775 [Lophiotrema nucula]|uniref:Uncharacterized protein n=1 Tax=Lophiotrema nucula TaxID=690887 RepID=A0A6A5YEQ4_9PLEO|nr:hypothetical protein BDV96DRAFT_374775 [Lophiotrema nucula]